MKRAKSVFYLTSIALFLVACGKSEQTVEDKINAAIDAFCECSDKICAEKAAKELKNMGKTIKKDAYTPEFAAGIESRMEACAGKFGMSKSSKKAPAN